MSSALIKAKIDSVPTPSMRIGTWPTPESLEVRIPKELLRELQDPTGVIIRQGWTVGLPLTTERCSHILARPELRKLVEDNFSVLLVPR